MRPPIPRFVRWSVVFAVIAALTVAVFQYWDISRSASGIAQAGVTQTPWGPLGPADRDLLIKVRQAGLWEGPTGQQAQQQASSVRVREVGGLLAAEHADLDSRVREVAAQLGVLLPNQPSEQQRGWMAEIAGQSGSDYDRTFVQRLRAAHGKVLPLLAEVRSGTRNEQVRQFATTAAVFVNRHLEYLESTGLVDFSDLPELPVPDAAPPAPVAPAAQAPAVPAVADASGTVPDVSQVAQSSTAGRSNVTAAAVVYIAALLAIVGLLGLLGTAGVRARRSQARAEPRPDSRAEHRSSRVENRTGTRLNSRAGGRPENCSETRPQPVVAASPGSPARARHAAQRW